MGTTVAATFCATLVDEWVRAGLRYAVIAPGSRSTPLALALAARDEIRVEVVLDERSAAYTALGIGLASGQPAAVLCTSGTAATHLHGAVVEAHLAEVPLLVCTADRPPELRDVSAPQTIDQTSLYGRAVRWFHDPGPPEDGMRPAWRALAARAYADASGPVPGPVHLNLPFRDPLVGDPAELPPGRPDGRPWHHGVFGVPRLDDAALDDLAAVLDQPRGIVIAGHGSGDPTAVHGLARSTAWPVLADPRSGCRTLADTTIAAFDDLLRHERFAADHRPTVVLRLGRTPASKVLSQWLAASEATQVQVTATPAWVDPEHTASHRVTAEPGALCRALTGRVRGASETPWLARWRQAEAKAQAALDALLAAELSEPAVARVTAAALPAGAHLVAASSMPVRDLEWYAAPCDEITMHANRGANGIDGVVSTAVGVAIACGAPTALLIGDIAFVHDVNGLVGLEGRGADLRIVVVDNDGGGIFSFLPQATELAGDRFEQLFGTPHGTDVLALAAAHGLAAERVATLDALRAALQRAGPRVLRVRTDRVDNVAQHAAIHAAIQRALG
jgi:2-succinyl-5-enolpyruvyl-6-hydroxy-3-cyclohexene-1-carboxylate synthase